MTVNRRDAELVAMDTNKDGVINMLDDPYSPYFPGADYVEWIGLSTYHYGWQPSQSPLTMGYNDATNVLPEPNRFLNIITGRNICPANQPIWSIYDIADKFDKPFGVPETAAVFYEDTINGPGPGELAIKQAWWKQILTPVVFRQLPRFKMVVWFGASHPGRKWRELTSNQRKTSGKLTVDKFHTPLQTTKTFARAFWRTFRCSTCCGRTNCRISATEQSMSASNLSTFAIPNNLNMYSND